MRSRSICLLFVIGLILSSCGQPIGDQTGTRMGSTWQEQYDLGMRYLTEGKYEEAIIAFTAAIEIDPKRAPAFLGRGQAYVLSGETETNLLAAQADYEMAIELDASNPEAWLGLANVYISRGDYDEALEILRKGMESTEENTSIAEKMSEVEGLIEDTFEKKLEFENFTVKIKNSRSAVITVSGLSLKDDYDDYLAYLSSIGESDPVYTWVVNMYGDQDTFGVSANNHIFTPGEEKVQREFNQLWHGNEGGGWNVIVNTEIGIKYTTDSITWTFTIPEEYAFDFANVNRYEFTAEGFYPDINMWRDKRIHRVYTLN